MTFDLFCTCSGEGNHGYNTYTGESDGEEDAQYSALFTVKDKTLPRKRRNKTHMHTEDMRKPVLVDSKGIPYGTMKKVLEQEMKLLVKDLDPRHSWEGQPQQAKDRFFKRVYVCMATLLHVRILLDFRHPRQHRT
jgi:hypothetical protein